MVWISVLTGFAILAVATIRFPRPVFAPFVFGGGLVIVSFGILFLAIALKRQVLAGFFYASLVLYLIGLGMLVLSLVEFVARL